MSTGGISPSEKSENEEEVERRMFVRVKSQTAFGLRSQDQSEPLLKNESRFAKTQPVADLSESGNCRQFTWQRPI